MNANASPQLKNISYSSWGGGDLTSLLSDSSVSEL